MAPDPEQKQLKKVKKGKQPAPPKAVRRAGKVVAQPAPQVSWWYRPMDPKVYPLIRILMVMAIIGGTHATIAYVWHFGSPEAQEKFHVRRRKQLEQYETERGIVDRRRRSLERLRRDYMRDRDQFRVMYDHFARVASPDVPLDLRPDELDRIMSEQPALDAHRI